MAFLSWVKEMDKMIDAIHPWMTTLPPYLHIFVHWPTGPSPYLQAANKPALQQLLRAHGSGPLLELVTSSMTCSALKSDSQPAIQVLKNMAWKKINEEHGLYALIEFEFIEIWIFFH